MRTPRKTLFLWLNGLSILVVLAAVAIALLYFFAPRLLEQWAVATLVENGIEVESIHVDRAGLTGSRLGAGALRLDDNALSWESISVNYVPSRLVKGHFDHLTVNGPVLRLSIPYVERVLRAPAEDRVIRHPEEDSPSVAGEMSTAEESLPRVETTARGADSNPPFVSTIPIRKKSGEEALLELIGAFPFRNGFLGNGRLEVDWGGSRMGDANWDSHFVNDPDRMNGEIRLQGGLFSSMITLRADKLEAGISIFGEMEVRPAPLMELLRNVSAKTGFNLDFLESLDLKTPLKAELLAESAGGSAVQVSGQVSNESFQWTPSALPLPIQFRKFLLLGTWQDGAARFEGGGRVQEYTFKDLSLGAFGLRFSLNPSGPIKLQTEKIELAWKDWRGEAAIRGHVDLDAGDGQTPASVELAFSQLDGPFVRIQPASILVEAGLSSLDFRASALGLERNSSIWLEEIAGGFNFSERQLNSRFTWYSGAGAHMGDVSIDATLSDDGGISATAHLSHPDGREFLQGSLYRAGDIQAISAEGELSNNWLNAFVNWWWGRIATLSGNSPDLELSLSRAGFIMKGKARLMLDSLNMALPDGPVFKGITGDLRFSVNGLPSSDGIQELRIKSLETGNFQLNNLRVDWSLPTIRNFRLNRATAQTGSGKVFLDPFSFDPVEPVIETALHFELIPAQQLLDWLKEKRFALEGTVTGKIPIRWESGILYVGEANLRMDSSTTINRFLFSDKAFLEEQFASMKGIPGNLKEPFLATLLADGIRIRDLTLALVPYPEKGEVALKLSLSGETRSESMEVPIESLIINNVISDQDLRHFLGLLGPIEFLSRP